MRLPSSVSAFAAVRGPLVFATLAVMLGTLPFLFMGTVVTAFSRPLVFSYAFAVLASANCVDDYDVQHTGPQLPPFLVEVSSTSKVAPNKTVSTGMVAPY